MAVEVQTYHDVQSLRTIVPSTMFRKIRIKGVCGKITSFFLRVVGSVVYSTCLYRKHDTSAGQLACRHMSTGECYHKRDFQPARQPAEQAYP